MNREWITGLIISSLIVAMLFASCDKYTFEPNECVYCEVYRSTDSTNYYFIDEDSYCSENHQILENFYIAYISMYDSVEANSSNATYCIFCESSDNLIFYDDCE